ncbi:hypothetical protein [Bradyrhizobium sp. WSM1743]|uniref:hypothetical protein n=1 Tax=Bradyrhizobium sp. WSM1743 TaxID=318996 RepID=UPI001FDA9A41|nr:hypothetical protein [Bradyrhizobium sp. WSM1743]
MAKEYAKKLIQLIQLVIRKTTHAPTAAFFMTGVPAKRGACLPKLTKWQATPPENYPQFPFGPSWCYDFCGIGPLVPASNKLSRTLRGAERAMAKEARFFRKQAETAERMARTYSDAELSQNFLAMAKAYRSQADALKAKEKSKAKKKSDKK